MENYTPRAPRPAMNAEAKDAAEPAVTPTTRSFSAPAAKKKQPKKWWKWAMAAVVVALVAGAGWFFLRNIGIPSYVDTGKYQVVCLQSGECYFGKITAVSSEDVQLKNVFYVQKTTSTSTDTTTASSDNNLQLIKLGNEVHGPEDMMIINRSQVLYMENLKSDGKVTQTINQYYEQNK